MDFIKVTTKPIKTKKRGGEEELKGYEVSYDLLVNNRNTDLMIRGRSFYAIWDAENNTWSSNELDVQRLIDRQLEKTCQELRRQNPETTIWKKGLEDFSSRKWQEYRSFIQNMPDHYTELDTKLTFKDDHTTKKDFVSKRLNYNLSNSEPNSYNELMDMLYDPEERQKIEWAVGAVVAGEVMKIQKFIVLFGEPGSGKSTVLKIIEDLFDGYYILFDAKALTTASNQFATAQFRETSLVAIQHDSDLSKIDDNSRINSIVSHEAIRVNEKHKSDYVITPRCMIFLGTNKAVKIPDALSGTTRRLVDVRPSGRRFPPEKYEQLIEQISFEHGAIANHCLNIYKRLGKNYYNSYRPTDMMMRTDLFYNFVEEHYDIFRREKYISLKRAFELFKIYKEEANIDYTLPKHRFREELKNYFQKFELRYWDGDHQVANVYVGFKKDRFVGTYGEEDEEEVEEKKNWLDLKDQASIFDELNKDCPAQLATKNGTPNKKWEKVETTLKDIDTKQVHYIRLEPNHVVIDFDLKGDDGEKSLELNLKEAEKWPVTYAEVSKSGSGIHLHYIYDGDPFELANIYSDGIEIKVFGGLSALRRKVTLCNNEQINHISSGLPFKQIKRGDGVLDNKVIQNEKMLRALILKNLKKEIHPGTKPSIDFIKKLLDDAFNSGMNYDLTTLRPQVLQFAAASSNHAAYCIKLVSQMQFKSEEISENVETSLNTDNLVFYDVEVFKNLFLVCFKEAGEGKPVRHLLNPKPSDIEKLFKLKLVGFNNRRFDDHILYAAYLGYTNEELYELSYKMINEKGNQNCTFREAYNLSYCDVWEFSADKQSLKKCEIELDLYHQELPMEWDQPVPEDMIPLVIEYCENDVVATEAVFNHRKGDFIGRQILADISGGRLNSSTNILTQTLIFGKGNKTPQLIYTDLTTGEKVY